jgi:predicted Zn-dependent protease with MMP-like domain
LYISKTDFERIVGEALDSLPQRFADLIQNVSVTVEDEPEDPRILGMYRGVALTERTHDAPLLPDEIVIFRGPISRIARSRTEAIEQIRETVIHEVGHYFGLKDEELP